MAHGPGQPEPSPAAGQRSPLARTLVALVGSLLGLSTVVILIVVMIRMTGPLAPSGPTVRTGSDEGKMTLAEMRAREREELNGYAWVSREKNTVRLPIDRAMDLLVRDAARAAATRPASTRPG